MDDARRLYHRLTRRRPEHLRPLTNDIAMVALTLGFFGLAWLYVRALERL